MSSSEAACAPSVHISGLFDPSLWHSHWATTRSNTAKKNAEQKYANLATLTKKFKCNASPIHVWVNGNELSDQEAAYITQTAGSSDNNKSSKKWNVRILTDGEEGEKVFNDNF